MSATMKSRNSGFTIVELLIVIVVIGILAAITIVTYNGIQTKARNTIAIDEVARWTKIFEAYKSQEGSYPEMADGGYCLGTDFPVGGGGVKRCRDYMTTGANGYLESGSVNLMNELAKVATSSSGTKTPVSGTVGPYAEYTATTVSIITVVRGTSASACSAPTKFTWTDGSTRAVCRVLLVR